MTNTTISSDQISFSSLLKKVGTWLSKNLKEAMISVLIATIIGFILNVYLMGWIYDGYKKVNGAPATGEGNLTTGLLIYSIASMICFALLGYWRVVGSERFFKELSNLPILLGELFSKDGQSAWIHLLWGAGLALIAMQIISPWLSGVLAIGLLATFPSILGSILSKFLMQVWSAIVAKLAPAQKGQQISQHAFIVALIGTCAALAAGFFIYGTMVKLLLAIICIFAAITLANQSQSKPPSALLLSFFTIISIVYIFLPKIVLAHDGGRWETGNIDVVTWLNAADTQPLLGYALTGGGASGIGAGLGWGLGNTLGEVGQVGPEIVPQQPTHIEQDIVSGPQAIQQLVNAGYTVLTDAAGNPVTDAAGNPLVLEPGNWGGGFHGGAYETMTVVDPVTGNNVRVLNPNNVSVIQDVVRPNVETLQTNIYSGNQAMDILEQSGLVVRVTNPDGTFSYRPRPSFTNLNGGGATIRTAEATDPATGEVTGAQESRIPSVLGVGYTLRPDGTLDPNIAIVVPQTESGNSLGQTGRWDQVTHPLPGVEVQGEPGFVNQVANDLRTIDSVPSGQNTLDGIILSGNNVNIKQVPPGSGNSATVHHVIDAFQQGATPGDGTDVTVGYDPTTLQIGSGLFPWNPRPPDVGLHHELVHALHATNGQMQLGNTVDPITGDQIPTRETQATGIGGFAGNDPNNPTDNSYRNERGIPPRPSYVL